MIFGKAAKEGNQGRNGAADGVARYVGGHPRWIWFQSESVKVINFGKHAAELERLGEITDMPEVAGGEIRAHFARFKT